MEDLFNQTKDQIVPRVSEETKEKGGLRGPLIGDKTREKRVRLEREHNYERGGGEVMLEG